MSTIACLFCQIAQRTLPAEIIAEEPGLVAFKDLHPQAPIHLLIIPTEHIATLADLTNGHTALVGQAIHLANRLARQFRLTSSGYRLVANCGAQAGQSVWHVHFHLLGGRAFTWPPG